jgi:hypothetical protein
MVSRVLQVYVSSQSLYDSIKVLAHLYTQIRLACYMLYTNTVNGYNCSMLVIKCSS